MITFRETSNERETIARIIAENARPGLSLTASDAIRIALAEWAQNHPEEDAGTGEAMKAEA